MRFLDARGDVLHPVCPGDWRRVSRMEGPDARWLQRLPPLRIACDVDNPLLGAHGATAVFGPQKGLKPDDFNALEDAVHGVALRVLDHFGLREESAVVRLDEPGGGAAGGTTAAVVKNQRVTRVLGNFPQSGRPCGAAVGAGKCRHGDADRPHPVPERDRRFVASHDRLDLFLRPAADSIE